MKLAGARVLVTGASRGFGVTIAQAIAGRGAHVIITGRTEQALRDVARGIGADVVVADLADRSDVDRLVHDSGEVDVLVANAALPAVGDVGTFSAEEIDRAIAVNLRAPMVLSRLLGDGMASRGRGHVVFVSSVVAMLPTPGLTIYNTTKSALASYGLALRAELARHGVGVSVIYPGAISQAGMWADAGLAGPTRSPAQVGRAVVRAIEDNRAEVMVAPVGLRLVILAGRAMPRQVSQFSLRMGASKVIDAMVQALGDQR